MTRTEYRVEEHDKHTGRYITEQKFSTYEYASKWAYETDDIYCIICKVTIEEVESIGKQTQAEEPKKELTSKEIKKAWETMKKNLKKELKDGQFHEGFVMNATQIANRTATKTVCKACSYDEEIEYIKNYIIKSVDWYDQETYERVKKSREEYMIYLEGCKQKYNTRREMVEATKKTLEESQSFKQFEKTVGKTEITIEIDSEKFYKFRFTY